MGATNVTQRYARLHSSIVRDPAFAALSDAAARLYVMLLAHPQLSACGSLSIVPAQLRTLISAGTSDALLEALDELRGARFVLIDDDSDELIVRTFIRYDSRSGSPNGRIAVARAIGNELISPILQRFALDEFVRYPGVAPARDDLVQHLPEHLRHVLLDDLVYPTTPTPTPTHNTQQQQRAARPGARRAPTAFETFAALAALPSSAREAVEIAAADTMTRATNVRNADSYRAQVMANLVTQFGDELRAVDADADAEQVAVDVLGVDAVNARRAARRRETR